MEQSSRENLMQSKREIIQGAKGHRAELEAYAQSEMLTGLAETLRQQSLMMCDAILEYFAAEDLVEREGAGASDHG